MTAPISRALALTKQERQERRKLRRLKQRVENVERAKKMHAERLAWERTAYPAAEPAPRPPSREVYVGCSGWFYWHWRGGFYPPDLPTGDWFTHYASHFHTVELNAPFYSWPTTSTVRSWVRQAGRREFVYTVKASELITHVKRFTGTKTLVRDFGHIADLLGPRMGCFLFQLPPSFHYTPARSKRILDQLDSARRNVVEFRHRSWWNARVFQAFREAGVIFCSCSGPGLPDDLVVTANEAYIRFHGIKQWYRHDYSKKELEVWKEKVQATGAERVWAYFNNDREGYAIKNSRTFRRLLKAV